MDPNSLSKRFDGLNDADLRNALERNKLRILGLLAEAAKFRAEAARFQTEAAVIRAEIKRRELED